MAQAARRAWFGAFAAVLGLAIVAAVPSYSQPPKETEEQPAKPGVKPAQPPKPGQPPKGETEETKPAPAAQDPGEDLGPKVELAEEAKKAVYPEVTALFTKLKEPFDEINHTTEGIIRAKPVPICLKDKSNDAAVKYTPVEKVGGLGGVHTAAKGTIRRITPFELIVVREVEAFLRTPLKAVGDRPSPKLDQFVAAETVLAAALQFHKEARGNNTRTGAGWDEVQQELRDTRLNVQVSHLKELADGKNWAEAGALLAKLAAANPDSAIAEPEIIRIRIQRYLALDGKGIADDDVAAIRATLDKLAKRYPAGGTVPPNLDIFRKDLPAQAVRLRDLGQKRFDENRAAEGVGLWRMALALYPELPNLASELARRTNSYPILYVGVPKLPVFMSPAAARSDADRQAVELLFESLVRAVPDVRTALVKEAGGLRWRPELSEGPPHLTYLGREFRITPGASWGGQPGERVTANDVAETLKLLRALKEAGANVPGDIDLLDAATVFDESRLSLRMAKGFVDPLSLMDFKILPADKLLKGKRADDEAFARRPVGSGPYLLRTVRDAAGQEQAVFTENGREQVAFVANSAYAARPGMSGPPARPNIREIRLVRTTDPAGDFRAGQLHMLVGASADEAAKVMDPANGLGNTVALATPPSRRVWILAVNHSLAQLQMVEMRRALGFAIDRKKCLDTFFRNGKDDLHKEMTGPFPPDCWATPPKSPPLFNTAAAGQAAEVRTAKQGAVRLTLLCPDDEKSKEVCTKGIKPQIEAAVSGVTIDVKSAPLEEVIQAAHQPGEFHLAYIPYDYASDLYWLGSLLSPKEYGGVDILGYTPDEELGAQLRDVRSHTDFAEVKKRMHKLHQSLVGVEARMPFIPLWQLDTPVLVSSKVQLPFPADRLDPLTVFNEVAEWKLNR